MSNVYVGLQSLDELTPYVQNQVPVPGATEVPLTDNVYLEIIDAGGSEVDLSTVVISIEDVPAVLAGVAQPGYPTTITAIAGGYSFNINPDVNFQVNDTIDVQVDASDSAGVPNVMPTVNYSFYTETAVIIYERCNPAPLLPVEIRLRVAFPSPGLETLRRGVLNVITTDPNLDHRIRGVLLTAHFNDFRAVLADVLYVPPTILSEIICKRRRLFELYADITPLQNTMRRALQELGALGLSQGYRDLIIARAAGPSPQQVVDAACAILLFGSLMQPEPWPEFVG